MIRVCFFLLYMLENKTDYNCEVEIDENWLSYIKTQIAVPNWPQMNFW